MYLLIGESKINEKMIQNRLLERSDMLRKRINAVEEAKTAVAKLIDYYKLAERLNLKEKDLITGKSKLTPDVSIL